MKDLQQYITSYFGVTRENLALVVDLFKETHLQKGDFFVKKSQVCDKLSFVNSRFIRVYREYEGKEVTQWISDKGYFITDLSSFIFGNRAQWNIQALTDCKLYTIEGENYRKLNDLIPEWSEIEKRFIAGCFLSLEERVFHHLSLSAEDRYDQLFQQNKELFNQVPLQYLASMLGMSAETLSRIRSKRIS